METLTTNIKHMLGALVAQGVTDFVVSPGSRSTPVALLLAELAANKQAVKVLVDVDERSAGFLALGIAKNTKKPVVLLATSGTATANYLPAVAEASISHIPLIILTTDRPTELQGIGAPQTINQNQLYGSHAKHFIQLDLQLQHPDNTEYIDYRMQQVVYLASKAPAGVIQVNLPLRKPLMPALQTRWPQILPQRFLTGKKMLTIADVTDLIKVLTQQKVLILVGPDEEQLNRDLLLKLSEKYQIPVIADALSSVRPGTNVINGIDVLLEADVIPKDLIPDVTFRFGATPVSARVLPWLKQNDVKVYQIGENFVGKDHSRFAQISVDVDSNQLLAQLLAQPSTLTKTENAYLAGWLALSDNFKKLVTQNTVLTEPTIAQAMKNLPSKAQLFVANSMPIRDIDNYLWPENELKIIGNRGANGIDGTISSAVGIATNGQPTYLLIGDLTLFHDMNGLKLVDLLGINLTIIVINNNGGGIFSFLPQAQAKDYFNELFGTPLNLEIAKIAQLYAGEYKCISTLPSLTAELQKVPKGLKLIEIVSQRDKNVLVHQALVTKIKQELNN